MEKLDNNQKSVVEKIRDWAYISTLIGASFLAGKSIIEIHGKYEQEREYKNHITTSLSEQEKNELDQNFSLLSEYFGADIINIIRNGDKKAFFERKQSEPMETVYIGFQNAGLNNKSVKKFISESGFFPKNFIEGEVEGIYFSESGLIKDGGKVEGWMIPNENIVVIFMKSQEHSIDEIEKEKLLWYIKEISSHELGHANDWENDKEINISERVMLLKAIWERLNSEDKLITREAKLGNIEYYESKKDNYKKAQEYWAELCKEYFSFPSLLKKDHPKDFEIVDNFMKKQDPNFNVFDVEGPYFDRITGELVDKWKTVTKNALNAN
jgi:hypothetical protein